MGLSSSATGLRPGVVTSTTRPTAPYTGQIIYETDTGYLRVWDGSAWDYFLPKQDTIPGAWTSWTPTITQGSTTFGLTVNYGKYTQINKLVYGVVGLVIASGTGQAGGYPLSSSIPVTAASGANQCWGSAWLYDDSTATGYGSQLVAVGTASTRFAGDWSGGSTFGATPSIQFTTNDQIRMQFFYEAA